MPHDENVVDDGNSNNDDDDDDGDNDDDNAICLSEFRRLLKTFLFC